MTDPTQSAASSSLHVGNPQEAQRLRREVARVPFWWHSIDLGHGVITPGRKGNTGGTHAADFMLAELERLRLPSVAGKSVLDIGAWDGYYSFETERRGAARVVALDHYVWSMDWEWARNGPLEAPPDEKSEEEELPGKRGFDLAQRELGSTVEPVVADFMTMDLEPLGSFDVVLFLGVLYHLKDPLGALRRLAQVTAGVAVIESDAAVFPGFEESALCEFFESRERGNDPGNWWAPNLRALTAMCRAAGFDRVEVVQGPPTAASHAPPGTAPLRYRAVVHAWTRPE
jgi:tRNA (mo5U34)-methyltransferase